MIFKTHLALGFLIGILFITIFPQKLPILFIFLVTIFSALPDIDHPNSKYGRKLKIISWPIHLIFKHRGFFHSVFPPIILFFVLSYFNLRYLGLAVLVGYTAHLIGDAVTKEGINFLHPFSIFHIRGPIRTGAIMETLVFYILIVFDLIYSLKLLGLLHYFV